MILAFMILAKITDEGAGVRTDPLGESHPSAHHCPRPPTPSTSGAPSRPQPTPGSGQQLDTRLGGFTRRKRNVPSRPQFQRSTEERRSGRGRGRLGGGSRTQVRTKTKSHAKEDTRPFLSRSQNVSQAGPGIALEASNPSVANDSAATSNLSENNPSVASDPTVANNLSVENNPSAGAVAISQHPNRDSGNTENHDTQVVLQEEPYLSPSFVRTDEDGQGFRHYRGFYRESEEGSPENEATEPGRKHAKPSVRSFAIPETIVKDGQIFYRYDGGMYPNEIIKGQSKRSHARDGEYLSDDGDQIVAHHALNQPTEDDHYVNGVQEGTADHPQSEHPPLTDDINLYDEPSHVQTQAHIGEMTHGATAEAVLGSGPATQVVGSAGIGGFFSAQAQSIGHPGGTSHTQVMGNIHGVQGSAITHSNGQQSYAHLQMGAHSSSRAQVSTHEGAPMLVSSVDATQLGGSAGAKAHSSTSAKSEAQMDFNPIQHSENNNGIRGHGLASAGVTSEGGSALATLTGQVSRGSYLGVAHSTSGAQHLDNTQPLPATFSHPHGSHFASDNNPLIGDGLQGEFMHVDFIQPELGHEEYPTVQHFYEGLVPGEVTHEFPSHSEQVGSDELEGPVAGGLTHTAALQERREEALLVDDPVIPSLASQTSMAHDMLSNIMETVHQPHLEPEVDLYSSKDAGYSGQDPIIDDGGLLVGSGTPPRESEIGQTPLHIRPYITEDNEMLTENIENGRVGLATYSFGRLGPAPALGDLLGSVSQDGVGLATYSQGRVGSAPAQGEHLGSVSQYDYDPYHHSSSEYLDNNYGIPSQQAPYFDLGPEIFSLEPIELSYEHLQPSSSAASATKLPEHSYNGQEERVAPDTRIVVHQLQTSTSHLSSEGPPFAPHLASTSSPLAPHLSSEDPILSSHLSSESAPLAPRLSSGVSPPAPHLTRAPPLSSHLTNGAPPPASHFTSEAPPLAPHLTRSPLLATRFSSEGLPLTPHFSSEGLPFNETSAPQPLASVETSMPALRFQDHNGESEGSGSASQPDSSPWPRQPITAEVEPALRPQPGQQISAEADSRPWPDQPITAEGEPALRPQPGQQISAEADSRPWQGQPITAEAESDSRPWPGQPITAEGEPALRPQPGQQISAEADSRPWQGQPITAEAESDSRPWPGQPITAEAETDSRPWPGQPITAEAEPDSRSWPGQPIAAEDMMTVPLVPTNPGTSMTLPGETGGPIVNVMTVSASHNIINSSLLGQRPGNPIQPGEKIPGVPGYRVPSGFRGHVILGHSLPVEADSRRVVEGFNTHVRLTPQDSPSNTVYASVGGPRTFQQLRKENVPGVHVTLSTNEHLQSPRVSSRPSSSWSPESASTSDRRVATAAGREWLYSQPMVAPATTGLTHSPMRAQPRNEPHLDGSAARNGVDASRGRGSSSSPNKSWDDGGVGSMRTPEKSWKQTWSSSNGKSWMNGEKQPTMCRYYTISCQVVYKPYQQNKICKPTYVTHEYCCC
nr:uncharacterized protein LOC128697666 [Cherax quadricarinatus]